MALPFVISLFRGFPAPYGHSDRDDQVEEDTPARAVDGQGVTAPRERAELKTEEAWNECVEDVGDDGDGTVC